MLFTWFIASAMAVEYYLEGPSVPDRSEALEMVHVATTEGHRARLVRRYRHGQGWEFIMLVEGFGERSRASEVADVLAGRIGKGVVVYEIDGEVARRVDEELPIAPEVLALRPARVGEEGPDAELLIERIVRAHGGTEGPAKALELSKTTLFRFRRTIPGLVVHHTVARRGEDVYVGVEIVSGEGVSSESTLVGERGWLEIDGTRTASEPELLRKVLAPLDASSILAFSLDIGRAVQERRELQLMYLEGQVRLDERDCYQMRYGGDQVSGPLSLAVDTRHHLVRKVVFATDGGDLVHEFSDYREIASGLVVPHHIRTSRNAEPVDEIEVLELTLDAHLPKEWLDEAG